MSHKAWTILETIIAFLGILLVAIGEGFFSQQREAYFRGITFVGAILLFLGIQALVLLHWKKLAVLAFLRMDFQNPSNDLRRFLTEKEEEFLEQFGRISKMLMKLRQVKFVNNFGDYCDACKEMLDKSSEHDTIMTIQTPVSLRSGAISVEEKRKYDDYIKATIEKIIHTDITYQRLVVLKDSEVEPEGKIKGFVRDLVETAVATEKTTAGTVDLSNTFVGFIHLDSAPDLIYNNLDIHITTERDFSVAFLSKTLIKQHEFGGSLHLHDIQGVVSRSLIKDVQTVWEEILRTGNYIEIGDYYKSDLGLKSELEKNKILANVMGKMDTIVSRLKGAAGAASHP